MDVVRVDEREVAWSDVVERVETGVVVEIMRGERILATVAPGEAARAARSEPHPSWKAAGFDWGEVARFAATLKPSETNSVVEMRKLARY